MFDRLFMPALTFTLLIAGFAAFSAEVVQGHPTQTSVAQLERVVVSAPREQLPSPVARAEAELPATIVVR